MEGEPNTDQLCVPDIVGVSGVQRTSVCVRRWCTSLAAVSHCARREALCYQRKRPASRVMLAVCFCEPPRCEVNPLSINTIKRFRVTTHTCTTPDWFTIATRGLSC